jgi:DNA-binding response OmpR family regulator
MDAEHAHDGRESEKDERGADQLGLDAEPPAGEESTRLLVVSMLMKLGFTVAACDDGLPAVELVRAGKPDLVVLDVGLPGLSGVEACRRIRAFSDVYVILLTGRKTEADKLVGFAAGCDDYVTKPFSPAELTARVRALQRRLAGDGSGGVRSFGRLSIDPQAREVLLDGAPVDLTRTEFDLLAALSGSPRLAFSRAQLIEAVWGAAWFGNDHLIDVHISNLRRKLGDARFVTTVRGVGYRMGADS